MPEPIAVAFVEIRPDTSGFKSQTEAQVAASLNSTRQLAASVRDVGKVDLSGTFAPVQVGAKAAANEVAALAAAVTNVPANVAGDLSAGLGAATTETAGLSAQTVTLGGTLSTSATAAGALLQKLETATTAEKGFAAATLGTVAAATEATVAEDRLFKVRARGGHGAGVGPFKIAGIGLGAGVAIFGATKALNELGQSLAVSGNEALTFGGRMRNAGAALISFDVVGVFKALTNETRSFSQAELQVIANTPGVTSGLKALGKGADLAKSQLAALEALTKAPAAGAAKEAQSQFFGDSGGQVAALRRSDKDLSARIKTARSLGADTAVLDAALTSLFQQRTAIRDKIKAIVSKQQQGLLQPLDDAVSLAQAQGNGTRIIAAFRAEKAGLQKIVDDVNTSADDRRAAAIKIANADKGIESAQQGIRDELKRHHDEMLRLALLPSEELITSADLTGSRPFEIATRQARAGQLKILIALETDRDQRIAFEKELLSVNQQIDGIQASIVADQKQHAADLKQKQQDAHQALLDSFGLRDQQTQIAEAVAVQHGSLAGQRAAIKTRIALLKDETKVLTGSELASATLALIAAENALTQLNKDAAKAREQALQDKVTLAGFTPSPKDDEQALKKVIADERRQSRDKTLLLAERRQHLIAERSAEKALRDLRRTTLAERISAQEQADQDAVTLAGFTEKTTKDDERALRKQIADEKRLSRDKRLSIAERRTHLIAEKQAEKALRDLTKTDGSDFSKQSFAFLTTQQGFAANLAGNLLGNTAGLVGGKDATQTAATPLPSGRAVNAEVTREAGGSTPRATQLEQLIALGRQQLAELRSLRAGAAHPEARTSKALALSGAGGS